ncbi:MAG: carboxypeptidase-like regulatory domain-containing protein [Candidatus Bathyarchaeia archaeon]
MDSNGHGIDGTHIIFNVPSVVPSVDSDSSGHYVISAPVGTYHINVWPPFDSNYIYYDEQVFAVESDITKNITLKCNKVSGHITDFAGTPVSGAVVLPNEFMSGWFSNFKGYYFVNVPAGSYNLTVKPRFGYDHFSSYFEYNFTVNGETTKNIIVSNYLPPTIAPEEEPFLDSSQLSTSTMWNRTYGGTPYETAESVIETSDGGYAVAGWRWYYTGMVLVKTDKFGNMEWVQTYGKNEIAHDSANSVIETSDGGYAIAGSRRSGERIGYNDFVLVKTDAYGNMEWDRTYGGTDGDGASAIVETSDGGYALAKGESLIKTDATGNKVWNQTFEGTERRSIISMITTSDGGYVLAGFYGNFDKPKSADFWLIKTNEHGYIPEFTSWIVLPAFLIISLSFIGYKKKLTNRL